MKRLAAQLMFLLLGFLCCSNASQAQRKRPGYHHTNSYFRKDGTHVNSYFSGSGATLPRSRGSRSSHRSGGFSSGRLGNGSSPDGSSDFDPSGASTSTSPAYVPKPIVRDTHPQQPTQMHPSWVREARQDKGLGADGKGVVGEDGLVHYSARKVASPKPAAALKSGSKPRVVKTQQRKATPKAPLKAKKVAAY